MNEYKFLYTHNLSKYVLNVTVMLPIPVYPEFRQFSFHNYPVEKPVETVNNTMNNS